MEYVSTTNFEYPVLMAGTTQSATNLSADLFSLFDDVFTIEVYRNENNFSFKQNCYLKFLL